MKPFTSEQRSAPAWILASVPRLVKTALTVIFLTVRLALVATAQQGPDELWKQDMEAAIQADRQGQLQDAEKYLHAALAQAEHFGPQDPRLARTLMRLGNQRNRQQKYDEAIEFYKQALAAAQTAPAEKIGILNNLAMEYRVNNQDAEAEKCFREALQDVHSSEPADPAKLKMILNNLGAFYLGREKYPEAEAVVQELLEVARNDTRPNPPRPAAAATLLSHVYQAEGKYTEAERTLMDEINAEEQQGEANLELVQALISLANHLKDQKEQRAYEEAALTYEHALQISEKLPEGAGRSWVAACLYGLGDLYDQWGMLDKAEGFYLRELDIEMESLGKQFRGFPSSLIGLGNLYRKQGRLEEILPPARLALTRLEQCLGLEDPMLLADAFSLVADYTEELGNHTGTEALLRRALSIRAKNLGPDNPVVAYTLQRLAGVLRASGKEAEAARLLDHVQKIPAIQKPQPQGP